MPHELLTTFLQNGLPGAVALLALWWAYRKDREAKQQAEEHQKAMEALEERYITAMERNVDKYQTLLQAIHTVADAFQRRLDRRGGGE